MLLAMKPHYFLSGFSPAPYIVTLAEFSGAGLTEEWFSKGNPYAYQHSL
jgi:hypothetical protein